MVYIYNPELNCGLRPLRENSIQPLQGYHVSPQLTTEPSDLSAANPVPVVKISDIQTQFRCYRIEIEAILCAPWMYNGAIRFQSNKALAPEVISAIPPTIGMI